MIYDSLLFGQDILVYRYVCILRAQENFPWNANPHGRKQGSFMYTNARETAIYALAVEQRP